MSDVAVASLPWRAFCAALHFTYLIIWPSTDINNNNKYSVLVVLAFVLILYFYFICGHFIVKLHHSVGFIKGKTDCCIAVFESAATDYYRSFDLLEDWRLSRCSGNVWRRLVQRFQWNQFVCRKVRRSVRGEIFTRCWHKNQTSWGQRKWRKSGQQTVWTYCLKSHTIFSCSK